MNTEQHIDPEVIEAAIDAFEKAPEYREDGPDTTDRLAMEAALRAADEKRRELAQGGPEGQEYVYRVWHREWTTGIKRPEGSFGSRVAAEGLADALSNESHILEAWVERALLGTWEQLD